MSPRRERRPVRVRPWLAQSALRAELTAARGGVADVHTRTSERCSSGVRTPTPRSRASPARSKRRDSRVVVARDRAIERQHRAVGAYSRSSEGRSGSAPPPAGDRVADAAKIGRRRHGSGVSVVAGAAGGALPDR